MPHFLKSLLLVFFFYLYPIPYTLYPIFAQNPGPGPAGVLQLQETIQRFLNISVYLGFFAVSAMLVWGAIKLLTSGGEPKSIQAAWQIITWALLGVIFMALAWLILLLVKAFTGVDVTVFCIGFPGADTKCPW